MKNLKKIITLFAAIAAIFALSINAFAATIYVEGGIEGQEYDAYLIFDLTTTGSGTSMTYIYTIDDDSQFYDLVKAYTEISGSGLSLVYVSESNGVKTYEVQVQYDTDNKIIFDAEAFAAYLKAAVDANPSSYKADATGTATAGSGTIVSATLTAAENGYYFINTNLGSLALLDTATGTLTVTEKNEEPSVEKTVSDDGTTYDDSTVVNVGDVVYYDVEITVGTGVIEYDIIVTDTLSKGLTFNNDIVITDSKNGTTWTLDSTGSTDETDYYVEKSTDSNGNTIIKITLYAEASYTGSTYATALSKLTDADDTITIKYSATLNEDAAVQGGQITDSNNNSNSNGVYLSYGRKHEYDSKTSTADVYTYRFGFQKTNGSTTLAGAKFKVTDENGNTIYLVADTPDSYDDKYTYYRVATDDEIQAGGTTLLSEIETTDETGKTLIIVWGLTPGTYYLVETEAPAGYNILTDSIKIVISDDGSRTYSSDDGNVTSYSTYVNIVNKVGTELPTAGGMGTKIFYTVGGILVIGAGILLITKRRMNSGK